MKTIVVSGFIGVPSWWQNDPEMAEQLAATKEEMRAELKAIIETNETEILVEVESYGGDVNHAIAMRNALAASPANVTVNYTGFSASAATIIATGANQVKAAENIMLLFHEARGGVMGVQETIENYSEWLDKMNGLMAGMYAEQANKDIDQMRELMARNSGEGEWLTAKEAFELGLLDEVYEPLSVAASFVPQTVGLPGIDPAKLETLNNLNMNIFKKKEKEKIAVNSLLLGENTVIFEGEIAPGSEIVALGGGVVEDGEYKVDDVNYIVEGSTIKEIQTPDPGAQIEERNETIEQQAKLIETLQGQVQAQAQELETIKGDLASIKSSHKAPEKSEVEQEELPIPLAVQVKKDLKELKKKKGE